MARPDRAVFRLPLVSLVIPVVVLILTVPLATVGAWWALLFVIPVVALAYVAVTSTTADRTAVRTRTLLGRHRMTWDELDGLEFRASSWAVAVAHDGRRLQLPMVRPRDLPRLAAASGGHLDLTGSGTTPDAGTGDDTGDEVELDEPVDEVGTGEVPPSTAQQAGRVAQAE